MHTVGNHSTQKEEILTHAIVMNHEDSMTSENVNQPQTTNFV